MTTGISSRGRGGGERGSKEGVAGDDVRVASDKSLSSFTVAFSISGSLRRSSEHIEREREKRRRFKEELMQAAFAKE